MYQKPPPFILGLLGHFSELSQRSQQRKGVVGERVVSVPLRRESAKNGLTEKHWLRVRGSGKLGKGAYLISGR